MLNILPLGIVKLNDTSSSIGPIQGRQVLL